MIDTAIDIRHGERDLLFKLLVAEYTDDLSTLILNITAKMEKQDVDDVKALFEQWKSKQK